MGRQIKYLNNIVEQDHRSIKKIASHMKGFKFFACVEAIIAGIELHHTLKKGLDNKKAAYLPIKVNKDIKAT